MSELHIEYMPLSGLQVAAKNPKRHALPQLEESVSRFGYVEPIVLDERTQRLVAGHGRREALLQMRAGGQAPPSGVTSSPDGSWLVPVVRGWASKSDKDAEAYLVASNRHVELGGWDNKELADLLKNVELLGTGFSIADLDALLATVKEPKTRDPDQVPATPPEKQVYVKPGDVWQLGRHRLLCGDSTRPDDVLRVLDGALADICWTDPPWNVAVVGGSRAIPPEQRRAAGGKTIGNDDLGDRFPEFCLAFCAQIRAALKPGAMLYLAMSTRELAVIDLTLRKLGFHWSSFIIWAKDSLVFARGDYHSQYEPIWYGWKEGAARLAPLKDRKQSDLWAIERPKVSEEHPTMKPVELVARSVRNSSKHGAIVFEPFSGSGTTIIACEQEGRCARAIELEPKYVQVAIERWQTFTEKKAKRIQSKK